MTPDQFGIVFALALGVGLGIMTGLYKIWRLHRARWVARVIKETFEPDVIEGVDREFPLQRFMREDYLGSTENPERHRSYYDYDYNRGSQAEAGDEETTGDEGSGVRQPTGGNQGAGGQ